METSISAATALHKILKRVVADANNPILQQWETTLDAESTSTEFAYRHLEVCALVSDVANYLSSLPEGEPTKAQYAPYLAQWHSAVCYREAWRSNGAGHLIGRADLDMLSGLGLLRDQKLTQAGLTESQVERLRESLREWHELLAADAFPSEVADETRTSVSHLEWLLDQIEMFGSEPIKRQGRNLLGLALSIETSTPPKGKWAETFKKAVGSLLCVLAATTAVTSEVNEIANNVAGIIEEARTISEDVGAQARPPALPPGTASAEQNSSDEE